jgi:hypothetical protein
MIEILWVLTANPNIANEHEQKLNKPVKSDKRPPLQIGTALAMMLGEDPLKFMILACSYRSSGSILI